MTTSQGGAVQVGVADEDRGRVFASRTAPGGIGLSLARALLEAGGGRLPLGEAHPTRFEILLPTTPVDGGDRPPYCGT